MEDEENDAKRRMRFRARKAMVLEHEPFQPQKENRPLTGKHGILL